MVVCTLCSCYPWEVLGLPPVWYKSAPYRSRAVIDPKGVLAEFGVALPQETEIRIWDSTAETRFLVLPMRPEGTEGWSEEQLARLVTRDSMVGTGLRKAGRDDGRGRVMSNTIHDMGGMHGFGPVEAEPNEPVFHEEWERPRAGDAARDGLHAAVDDRRRPRLDRNPAPADLSRRILLPALVSRLESGSSRTGWLARTRSRRANRCGREAAEPHTDRADLPNVVTRGNFERPASAPARFKQGDRVSTRNINPETHTRLPRYARGKLGTVEAIRGCHVYPDRAATGDDEHAAMALHGRLFGAASCGARRPTRRQGLDRGVRAVSRSGMTTIARNSRKPLRRCRGCRATRPARCSSSRGRRRPSR